MILILKHFHTFPKIHAKSSVCETDNESENSWNSGMEVDLAYKISYTGIVHNMTILITI